MDKHGFTLNRIPLPDIKHLQMIPLGNLQTYSEKNIIVSSGTSLKTETTNIPQVKTQPKLQTKYKESNPSSLEVS